jgi:tRNA U34 2-thiouridine synthase MnmA/TrmU
MDGDTPTKFDLEYAEAQVRFSICDCSLDKKYSFWCLNKEQAEKFIKRLKHIEKLTWKQLANLPRKNGLTPEKQGSPNFDLVNDQNTSESKFFEQYYFHFRVEQTDLFRVFGYQHRQFFCITHIDPNGKINH